MFTTIIEIYFAEFPLRVIAEKYVNWVPRFSCCWINRNFKSRLMAIKYLIGYFKITFYYVIKLLNSFKLFFQSSVDPV
jgi:hypothetical protein